MREILFKGQTKSDKKWIYGNLLQTDNGTYVIQNYSPFEVIGKYEVDPETVCQYTGLTGKNGRKIFEGDCLGHKENVVEYMCGGFVVSGDRPLSMMAKYNEVIGNIFDKE